MAKLSGEEKQNKKKSGLHDGHRDRMREKFRRSGLDNMHPHEMLEMLLYYSVPRKDTNELAHSLIEHFGSFAAVFEASEDELVKVPGISYNTATLIKMILPLSRVYHTQSNKADRLNSPTECGNYFVRLFEGYSNERVMAIYLDNRCRVLCSEQICEGDVSQVVVNFRKIIKTAMKYPLASAVVIAHNHPGGIALPSQSDITATQELIKTLGTIGVNLVDHIIVAGSDYTSMASSQAFKKMFGM